MTKDDIILIADASQLSWYGMGRDRDKFLHYLEAFATLIAASEREACANLCDKYAEGPERNYSENIADDIRARGNT
jgi:hypothetical protein